MFGNALFISDILTFVCVEELRTLSFLMLVLVYTRLVTSFGNVKETIYFSDGFLWQLALCRKIGRKLAGDKGQFKDVMSVCVTAAGEIVIADTRIVVFDMDGNYLREFGWKTLKEGCRGRYQVCRWWQCLCPPYIWQDVWCFIVQGLTMDRNGLLLAVKSDKVQCNKCWQFHWKHWNCLKSN